MKHVLSAPSARDKGFYLLPVTFLFMKIDTLFLYLNTLRYTKPEQIRFMLFYLIRGYIRKATGFQYSVKPGRASEQLTLSPSISTRKSLTYTTDKQPSSMNFTFLNKTKHFDNIDWNFSGYGKLWLYNLNYFDFLNQKDMGLNDGKALVQDFYSNIKDIHDGLEPYPISLRTMNWIKFFTLHRYKNSEYDNAFFMQAHMLLDNLEYHLMGNHLLENGFALLFAAYYFQETKFYFKAKEIITHELEEQVLPDGGHFELSPMYHQIILFRLLDAINLVKNNDFMNHELLDTLSEKAAMMLTWLSAITFEDGSIPLFNDSANSIAPTTAELNQYAARLGIAISHEPLATTRPYSPHPSPLTPHSSPSLRSTLYALRLNESGYRKIKAEHYEAVIDVGSIGPDYIPGHAHADTLSFELRVDGMPFVVDTGTSTYEDNAVRHSQRSTKAHNTVTINERNSSEVWGSFRVARRAKIVKLDEDKGAIMAAHDGYKRIGAVHTRRFEFRENEMALQDTIDSKNKNNHCHAYLHFAPGIDPVIDNNTLKIGTNLVFFDGADTVRVEDYEYAPEFNTLVPAKMAIANFNNTLHTTFSFKA